MLIENLPQPLDRSYYDDAVDEYVRRAGSAAVAIYRAGNVGFPGISDLDLVVVPRRSLTASWRLHTKRALEPSYERIVHHPPFIVPQESLKVFRYSYLSNLRLVHGHDVLSPIERDLSSANALCTLLDALHAYALFAEQIEAAGRMDAVKAIPVFSALRFSLTIMVDLGLEATPGYAERMDVLRRDYLAAPSESIVCEMHMMFRSELQTVGAALKRALGVDIASAESLIALLASDAIPMDGVESGAIKERGSEINRYLSSLGAGYFGYGSLFVEYLYPPIPKAAPVRFLHGLKRLASSRN